MPVLLQRLYEVGIRLIIVFILLVYFIILVVHTVKIISVMLSQVIHHVGLKQEVT